MTTCDGLAYIDKLRADDARFVEWDVELHGADLSGEHYHQVAMRQKWPESPEAAACSKGNKGKGMNS